MKYFSILICLLLICAHVIKTSNILIFVPSPYKSHIVSFQPLFMELANRGHNLTVVTKFPIKNAPLNYKQIVINYELDFLVMPDNEYIQIGRKYLFLLENFFVRNIIFPNITKTFLSSRNIQTFINEDQSIFDLVIVESFFQECTVAMGHKYGAPVISIIPLAPWANPSRWAANPTDVSYIKDFFLDEGKSLNFQNRLFNFIIKLCSDLIDPIFYFPNMENMMNSYFQYPGYKKRPTMKEMLKNISIGLIDSDITILSPRPYVPSFIEVPGIHLRPTTEMKNDLKTFMDRANSGVVYFNLGTLLNVTSLPKSSLRALINVLGRLEQKIVFKWISNDTYGFPNNFFVDSWLPQQEILKHPNCKLFITHGGVHGIMETIDAGIPIIGFPIFGDQFQNLKISQNNGFCIISDIFKLTERTFEKDVKLILSDKKFVENAKKISLIFHDRPISALDKAIYWVEYVIRYKGDHNLSSVAIQFNWYQYYLLDVIVFFTFITLLIISITFLITKYTIKPLLNSILKQKQKQTFVVS